MLWCRYTRCTHILIKLLLLSSSLLLQLGYIRFTGTATSHYLAADGTPRPHLCARRAQKSFGASARAKNPSRLPRELYIGTHVYLYLYIYIYCNMRVREVICIQYYIYIMYNMEYVQRRIPRMARSADHERHPVRRRRIIGTGEAHSAPVSVRWSLSSFDNINLRPRPTAARRTHLVVVVVIAVVSWMSLNIAYWYTDDGIRHKLLLQYCTASILYRQADTS